MDLNRVYDLRVGVDEFGLFSSSEVDNFNELMKQNSGKKKQDSSS